MHFKEKLGTFLIAALFVACPNDPGISSNFSVGGSATERNGIGIAK